MRKETEPIAKLVISPYALSSRETAMLKALINNAAEACLAYDEQYAAHTIGEVFGLMTAAQMILEGVE